MAEEEEKRKKERERERREGEKRGGEGRGGEWREDLRGISKLEKYHDWTASLLLWEVSKN